MLPSDQPTHSNTISDLASNSDPALANPLEALPPRYDSHQFPPTPPALHSSHLGPDCYFDQSHRPFPDLAPQAESSSTPFQPPPPQFASRFPRWGSWLEKRALERHYARLDIQRQADQNHVDFKRAEAPHRKKSWGAWVNDPDAINDASSASTSRDRSAATDDATLPSLHLHHYGSRFIPHLPTQPLCSILVDLPTHDDQPTHGAPPSRQILLVGTATGLYAVRIRASLPPSPAHLASESSDSSKPLGAQWNDHIQCLPIWTGLAVYQMSILASPARAGSASGSASSSRDTPSSGVLLALTCPSTAKDGFLTSTLLQLSAQAGSILDSVAASGSGTTAAPSSSHTGHSLADSNEGIAAANFGPTAGGGAGRAVPPGGTGVVRMWHLQAIRDLLVYAFDKHDAQLPIDLTESSSNSADKRTGLGTKLKKTFAKQKGKTDAKDTSARRSASSTSLSATVQPLPRTDTTGSTPQGSRVSSQGASSRLNGGWAEQGARPGTGQTPLHDHLRSLRSSQTSPSSVKHQREDAHAAAVSLAKSSVPIRPPPHATSSSQGNNASFSSLFADDLIQSFSGTRQSGGKGKDREAEAQAASKGVLFFSVHEADKNTKGSGTWYLAITYARSVMVYEASVSKSSFSRSWSFVKELYAPFPVKAVAFAPVAVPEEPELFTGLGTATPGASTTFLKVASAEGPLSTSKKGPSRDHGRQSRCASPIKPPRGSAAPAAWHKADLCIMLSFGRRAVLVRLRDSHVREMELKPLSQVIAATADGTESMLPTQLSLQDRAGLTDRSRPLSMVVDAASNVPADRQASIASRHSRTGSIEQKVRDVILDKRTNKHNWTGFSSIEARIPVRQWSQMAEQGHGLPSGAHRAGQGRPGPSLFGLPMARGSNNALSILPVSADKQLPRTPAPQNASFDRRDSQLHLSEQSSQYHNQLLADSSDDSDDFEDDRVHVDERGVAAKYQLSDPGPSPRSSSRPAGPQTRSEHPRRSSSLPSVEIVSAKLALASRGSLTHVLRLPLAANLGDTNPLAVLQWSDTPNAVSGWSRVLGIERASTKGATTLGQLRQAGTRKNNSLVLHVGVTCVAFLASRIESRKVTFEIPVEVDFDLLPDSELELIPLSPDTGYDRMNGGHAQAPETETGEGVDPTRDTASFAYPTVQTAGHQPAGLSHGSSAISQELEYLCAPLLTLNPTDLDLHSCGAHSLVLPLTLAPGQRPIARPILPDLAGDAAVIAFDWRGADDFRVFTVGIAG